jgi:hypothetical protein
MRAGSSPLSKLLPLTSTQDALAYFLKAICKADLYEQ